MKNNHNNSESQNYLDYVPSIKSGLRYDIDNLGNVIIYMENKGIFNAAAQKFFGKPKISQIHLDEFGNFVWQLINGKNNIYYIGTSVREKFGDRAEPLYARLIQHLKTMENYGFISIEQKP